MLFLISLFAASIIFVEGATDLVCKSSIFAGLRTKLSSLHPFIKQLLGCGYCTSFWMATIPAGFFAFKIAHSIPETAALFVFLVVVFQRLSNYMHNINDKHFDKYYDNTKEVRK